MTNQALEAKLRITLNPSELKCYELSKVADKFRYLPERDVRVSIGKLLNDRIFEMIGLRPDNFPSATGAKDISYFIYKRYPEFTLEDIYNAFEFALAEITTPPGNPKEDWLNHYQNFNIKYLVPILNSYRKYKSAAVTKIEKQIYKTTEANNFLDIRIKNDLGIKRNILLMYQYFLEEIYESIFTTENEYHYLDELGLIVSTPEEKNRYMKEAKAEIMAKGRSQGQLKNAILATAFMNKNVINIYALAKHKCILQLFHEFAEYGVPIWMFSVWMNNACFIDIDSHNRLIMLKQNDSQI